MIRVPGYGDHLEALNPGTLARHKELGAPEGFSDAIGWMQPPATPDGPARWVVTFSVADADDAAARTPSSAAPCWSSRSTSRTSAWP